MKIIASTSIVGIFVLAQSLYAQPLVVLVTIAGLENFATQTTTDLSKYYTNAEASGLGYGTNALGEGFVVTNVLTSFNNSDFNLGGVDGGDFLTITGLTPGQSYTATYLVANYSSIQRSVLSVFYDGGPGGAFLSPNHQLIGPAISPSHVGWSDGAGQPITWSTSTYTFNATDSTFSVFNIWDAVDYSNSIILANSLGLNDFSPEVEFLQVAIGGISVAAIPEPSSSMGVLVLGAAGLLIRRRKAA